MVLLYTREFSRHNTKRPLHSVVCDLVQESWVYADKQAIKELDRRHPTLWQAKRGDRDTERWATFRRLVPDYIGDFLTLPPSVHGSIAPQATWEIGEDGATNMFKEEDDVLVEEIF